MTTTLATVAWCEARDHPWVTYNPHLDSSWCRCGARTATSAQPMDWRAKHEQHHTCDYDQPGTCRCYTTAATANITETT